MKNLTLSLSALASVFVLALHMGCTTPEASASKSADDSTRSAPAMTVKTLAPVPDSDSAYARLLQKEILERFERAKTGGILGMAIYSSKFNRYEVLIGDTNYFTPASTYKLLVTAAAIDAIPLNYLPQSFLELWGQRNGSTFTGRIVLVGGGDPNLSARFLESELSALERWVDSLRSRGIDTLRGQLTWDESFFQGPHRPPHWKKRHYDRWFGAEVSALSFNDNCFLLEVGPGEKAGEKARVQVTPDVGYITVYNETTTMTGRGQRLVYGLDEATNRITLKGSIGLDAGPLKVDLPVRNPPAYLKAAFLHVLRSKGVHMEESPLATDSTTPSELQARIPLATVPLLSVAAEVNQMSQNLHAEMLLRHLGRRVRGSGSDTAGIRAINEFIAGMGLDTADFVVFDGSGLSDRNKVKPRSFALLLAGMARHRYGKHYISTLAAPGIDGASGVRLQNLKHMESVRYKTGYIDNVQGLCGYVFSQEGDTLSVVLFNNGYRSSPQVASRFNDSLLTFLASWYNMERPALADAYRIYLKKPPKDYQQRLKWTSTYFEGSPYHLGPTGEGRFAQYEAKPMVDLKRFDCVTYIESIVALSAASSPTEMLDRLREIRYESGEITYASRNHYFVNDWIANNADWVRIRRFDGDTTIQKPIDKVRFFKSKGLSAPVANPSCPITYVPYNRALELLEKWPHGEAFLGVAFVTDIQGLDVTHTGLLVAEKGGKPMLRHAGQLNRKVQTEDFHRYLQGRRGKCKGVLFFEFLDPKAF